MTVFGKR